ncbi:MAG: hypothetical protein L6R42_000595 [Xanthoria sp. 1 TBL-2021]|nr:MAG: hypothetical protein L6R42_000595 [Xanthoria sp. 1 TBL-2021]
MSRHHYHRSPTPPPPPPPPLRPPEFLPAQGFEHPYSSNPLAPYTLPISRPPLASHTQQHRHHGSHTEEPVYIPRRSHRDGCPYDSRRSRRDESHRDAGRSRWRDEVHFVDKEDRDLRAPARHYDHDLPSDEMPTDASMESDVSDALSANSFTFDDSVSDVSEKQTDKQPTAKMYASIEVAASLTGKNTEKPSPYLSSGPTVLYSRFVGDAVAQTDYCTADLSVVASTDLVRLKKEPLFQWM